MHTHDSLIDMAEAAEILDVSRYRVYYLVMDGRLEVVKIRHRNYFTRETLDNYLKSLQHGRAKDKTTATANI